MKKRLLAMIMAVVMAMSILPVSAFATEGSAGSELQAGEVRASKALVLDENGDLVTDEEGYYTVQITVQGKPVQTEKAADVILCIDVSNSMTGDDGYVVEPGEVCNGEIREKWEDQGAWKWSDRWGWYWDSEWVLIGYYCSKCGHEWAVGDELPSDKRCDQGGNGEGGVSAGVTRLDIAKSAAAKFAEDLLGEGMDVQMAAVAFGGKNGGETDTYLATCNLTNDESVVKNFVNDLKTPEQNKDDYSGGTNYTCALATAENTLDARTDKTRDAYILFLSDGKPGYNSQQDYTQNTNWNGTVQAKRLIDSGVTIYTGGIAIGDTDKGPLVAISSTKDDNVLYKAITNDNMADDLASLMNVVKEAAFAAAGTNAVVTDVVNTTEFDYKLVDTTNVTDSNGTVTWNIGDITETPQSIQIKVKPKAGNYGNLYTNESVELSYTDYNDQSVTIKDTKTETGDDIQIGNPYITVQAPTPESFQVKYEYTGDVPGGAPGVPEVSTAAEGSTVTVATVPTLNGYTFDGWKLNGNVTTSFTMPGADVLLTGSWVAKNDTAYTIEYYLEDLGTDTYTKVKDATEISSGTTGVEVSVDTGKDSTDANFKAFAGFTYDASNANNKTSGTIAADGSLVLKLYYTRDSYEVTYEYTGTVPENAPTVPEKATYEYGATVTVAEDATLAGYTFNGWNKGTEEVNGTFVMPAQAVELCGFWTANADTQYKIEYYLENLDGTYSMKSDATEEREGTTGTEAKIQGTDDIKNFDGFAYDEDNEGNVTEGIITGDGSLVLKLYYERKDYSLSYDCHGGKITAVATDYTNEGPVTYGVNIDEPVATEMEKAGYVFEGWYLDDEYKQPWDVDNGTMPYKELTLHAKWRQVIYEISGIKKEVVQKATEVNTDATNIEIENYSDLTKTLTFPNGGKVEVPRDGSSITLLYRLTVTGEASANYVVTDDNATWVGGDEMSGNIGADKQAVIYVTKTFTLNNIENGKVSNTATVKPGDSSKGEFSDTEVTDAEIEDANVSVTKAVTKVGGTTINAEQNNIPLAQIGETIEWTITVKNIDTEKNLEDIIVTDTLKSGNGKVDVTVNLPAGVTDNKDGTYTVASLAPGAEVVITASYTVAATDAGSTLTNSVVAKESDKAPGTEGTAPGVNAVNFTKAVVLKGDITIPKDAQNVDGVTYLETADTKITLKPGKTVTLMYAITVTGTEGDTYTVTDKGTTYVASDIATSVTDNKDGTYTVKIANDNDADNAGTVVIYVTKTFDRDDIENSKLTNVATLTDKDKNTTDAEESTPGEKGSSNNGGSSNHKPALNKEDHYAYIVGYPDGTVQPGGNITRAEVATIFFRMLTDDSRNEFWSQTNSYSDVSEGQWFNNAISTLANAGILSGYPDGTFRPNAPITRAEFTKIAASFFERVEYTIDNPFNDVDDDDWFYKFVMAAYEGGLITGYPEGDFRPNANISRAESVTIVNRTLERAPDADHFLKDMIVWPDNAENAWYYEAVQEATNSHEYVVKGTGTNKYEEWTKILEVRDWPALEKEWSNANSATGGEVVK